MCRPLEAPDCLQPLGYEDPYEKYISHFPIYFLPLLYMKIFSALAALSEPVSLPTSTPSTWPTSWSSPVSRAFTPTAAPAIHRSTSELKICQFGSFCTADSDCVAGRDILSFYLNSAVFVNVYDWM